DGKLLAASMLSHKAILWDATTGKELQTIQTWGDGYGLAFSPDGKILASGRHGGMCLWEVATGKELSTVSDRTLFPYSLAFAPDGKTVATVGGGLRLWEVPSGKEVRRYSESVSESNGVVFSTDGTLLATANDRPNDLAVYLLDVKTSKVAKRFPGNTWATRSLAFSPDGKTLAAADCNETKIWDVKTGERLLSLPGGVGTFSPDGKTLAVGCANDVIRLYDPTSGKERVGINRHAAAVFSLAISRDTKQVVTHDYSVIRLWDAATGKLLRKIPDAQEHGGSMNYFALTPDGMILATISTDHTIRCSDTATGKEIGKCVLKDGLLSLAFSPDGLLLAVSDQRIRLLNTATNKEVRKFDDSASLLMFSPDGKTLVSGTPADPRPRYSQPGLICLWDVKTGK